MLYARKKMLDERDNPRDFGSYSDYSKSFIRMDKHGRRKKRKLLKCKSEDLEAIDRADDLCDFVDPPESV